MRSCAPCACPNKAHGRIRSPAFCRSTRAGCRPALAALGAALGSRTCLWTLRRLFAAPRAPGELRQAVADELAAVKRAKGSPGREGEATAHARRYGPRRWGRVRFA